MNIVIKRIEQTSFSYKDIVDLIHLSFEERKKEGLLFSCINISEEEYRSKGEKGYVFCALDIDSGDLLGTALTHIRKDKHGKQFGYFEQLAVHPSARRLGIASSLLCQIVDFQEEKGSEYLISDTATGATSSVKYHLRNGFKIVGLRSFSQTNYYSYILRRQLAMKTFAQRLFTNDAYCRCLFSLSFLKTKCIRKKDGQYTRFASFLLSLFKPLIVR